MIRNIPRAVVVTLIIYAMATTAHFVHNAVFLDDYPNLPAWFTPAGVIGVLLLIHLVGVLGVVAAYFSKRVLGLVLLGTYAVIGFDGLAHYSVASFRTHTLSMNLTILIEVIAAFLLFVCVLITLFASVKSQRRAPQ